MPAIKSLRRVLQGGLPPGALLACLATAVVSLHAQNPGSYNAANAKAQTPAEEQAALALHLLDR